MKLIKVTFALLCFTHLVFSQNAEVGNWFIYFGNHKISEKWNWHNEVQYRSFNLIDDPNQLLLRTGIGYNLSENNNNLFLGYGFINTQRYVANSEDKVNFNEHRIFQQFITRQNFGRFFLQHRYRIEERFLQDDFQLRFRYFLGLNVPINKRLLDKNTFYMAAYNELFINAESPLFDRNRLYGALGYVINKSFKVEAGFMAQTLEKSNRNQFQIVVFNNLPF
jgi:hypothetical protein